jgi:Fasciclin domain
MQRCLKNTIAMIGSLVLISIFACKKTHTTPTKVELTPLQTLINTDTTLSLYHLMIVQANDEVLLSDAAATLFFPTNVVLEQAGYTDVIIDSMSSTLADRIVKYNYVPGAINTDSAGYTANPTLLGVPLYIAKLAGGQLLLNASVTVSGQSTQVGKATVYYLDSLVPAGADSLSEIVQSDSTLTFFSEVLNRTNLYDSLLLTGSYTLLAPNNQAFINAGYDSIGAIDSANINSLINLAMNQVVKGAYFTNNFPATVTTLFGVTLNVSTVNGYLQFEANGGSMPVNWLSGNQIAGPTLILQHTDGIIMSPAPPIGSPR